MFSFINSVCVLLLVGHKLFSFINSVCVVACRTQNVLIHK